MAGHRDALGGALPTSTGGEVQHSGTMHACKQNSRRGDPCSEWVYQHSLCYFTTVPIPGITLSCHYVLFHVSCWRQVAGKACLSQRSWPALAQLSDSQTSKLQRQQLIHLLPCICKLLVNVPVAWPKSFHGDEKKLACHTWVKQHQPVAPNEVQPTATSLAAEQEHKLVVLWVVELLDQLLALADAGAAIQAQKGVLQCRSRNCR